MRDTFHTYKYKDDYITSCYDRALCCFIYAVGGREFKSERAAKSFITRRATK